MGAKFRLSGAAFACTALFAPPAGAQSAVDLPQIDVTSSRVGSGITGASTSVITAEEIERSPSQNLPDILAQHAGFQVMHVLGGASSSQDLVDLRGFGAFSQSNVLVLVNGRRYQDFDLQGFDFSSIPLNSIERVEVTRGNSGAVLYGDGAVGGVINIITKKGAAAPFAGRVEGAIGSYGYQEGRGSVRVSSGPWTVSAYGNAVTSSGYRQNSELRQENGVANLNYQAPGWSAYLNIGADEQRQNLPGALPNLPLFSPFTLANPRASVNPFDWGHRQDFNVTTGFTDTLGPGVDLIVDGGVRRKFQRSEFFNYFSTGPFDPSTAVPSNFINTGMTTTSLTPRVDMSGQLFGIQNHLLTGLDFYNTRYDSDRYEAPGGQAIHHYNIQQTTAAIYAMNTAFVLPDLDISFGGRLQSSTIKAQDDYNAGVDPNAPFYSSNPQAPPLDSNEWQYAAHLGYEYRANSVVTLFGRIARAFLLPNADEHVAAGNPFGVITPANFNLKTQTSYDIENGIRLGWGPFKFQTSAYVMELNNEIHFIPALNQDINLDPTQRIGWENSATYQLTNDARLRGTLTYTRATFREGSFAGNQIPLVSPWSGSAGATWNIAKDLLVLDVAARFAGERRMDNDQANFQPQIPAIVTVDVKLGGKYDRFFWSVAVENLFNVSYFDYAIASATTAGFYNAYPQPRRTVMLRAGTIF
jgi:iron complex outermembrane receptor protein